VKQVVRSFYKRVDALTSQALVSAELMATSAEMVQVHALIFLACFAACHHTRSPLLLHSKIIIIIKHDAFFPPPSLPPSMSSLIPPSLPPSCPRCQAKRKAVKVQLGTSKKALRGPMRDTLTEKAAMMAAAQAALEAAHVLAAESFSAEVAKVREEFAMWPEAAGIRAVCDLYADMQDREEARTAQTNRLGSRAAC